MAKQTGNEERGKETVTTVKLEEDLDALFQLPPTEFTAARNTLAARLKKTGRGVEAERVKALVKPSISAWAVNQLYWRHRHEFDGLIAAGERLRRAHTSQLAGETSDTRGPHGARREALAGLTRLADALLRDAGHNPTPDTMRRITTTLEALSAYSSLPDAPRPGRLTGDVDPPGFESLAALMPGAGQAKSPAQSTRVIPFQPGKREEAREAREARQAKIASAKAALEAAEQALLETRTVAQNLEAALKKATAHADQTEKDRREAQERFANANIAMEEARRRVHSLAVDAQNAARALANAERAVDKARKELSDQAE